MHRIAFPEASELPGFLKETEFCSTDCTPTMQEIGGPKIKTIHKYIIDIADIFSFIPLLLCLIMTQLYFIEMTTIGYIVGIGFLVLALPFWGWERLEKRKKIGEGVNFISGSRRIHAHTKHVIYRFIPALLNK